MAPSVFDRQPQQSRASILLKCILPLFIASAWKTKAATCLSSQPTIRPAHPIQQSPIREVRPVAEIPRQAASLSSAEKPREDKARYRKKQKSSAQVNERRYLPHAESPALYRYARQRPSSYKKNQPTSLTREEEYEAVYQLRALRAAVRTRDDLVESHSIEEGTEEDDPKLWEPSEEEWASACGMTVLQLRRTMQDGFDARARLVSANAKLVKAIANKHSGRRRGHSGTVTPSNVLVFQDLVQEGNIGIMEAAERFEPERGFRFGTYASWWVRQRICQSIVEYSRLVRLPPQVHWMVGKTQKAKKELERQLGRQPTVEEIANYLGISIDKVCMYQGLSRSVLSLEAPLSNSGAGDDTRTLADTISCDSREPGEDAELRYLRKDVFDVINQLATLERDVVIARFGLDNEGAKTVDETAKILGISRDRVRAVEAKALTRLRNPQCNYKLKEYAGITDEEYDEELEFSAGRIWSL